jgi:hypothetical protein
VAADGKANNAATIHTPQIVATVLRHVGFEETRTWKGVTITLYRWMLSRATEYADRQTDRRRQNRKNLHINSSYCHSSDILFAQASKKRTVTKIISLIAKIMMYILGTVRMSLLNMIMIRMMTLLVIANIKRTAYIGA